MSDRLAVPHLDTRPRGLRLASSIAEPDVPPLTGAGWQASRSGSFVLATLGVSAGMERGVVTALLDPAEARTLAAALNRMADEATR